MSINDSNPLGMDALAAAFRSAGKNYDYKEVLVQPVGGQQAMSGAQRQSPSEIVRKKRFDLQAKARVLEYFEAQLNMKIFEGDTLAQQHFNLAMAAAVEYLIK